MERQRAMIVYKSWYQYDSVGRLKAECDGWFLFGIIPLYIRRHEV